ncbi:hypothetical protein [Ensifer adhaerens]|uniref:hypothetical protein n=1 Tax=Ensifer adhaerens TaxID=106592 RepID=UPI001319CD8B|nr:hypothetical protein [Ensifer adhaerens]
MWKTIRRALVRQDFHDLARWTAIGKGGLSVPAQAERIALLFLIYLRERYFGKTEIAFASSAIAGVQFSTSPDKRNQFSH